MRESIQLHITTLAKTLVFKESEIPDMIIQHDVATSSECEKLRKLPTHEDQVSGLVSMVIQRDISCMMKFLDIAKKQNQCVVNEIQERYEYLTHNCNMVEMPCVACELKQKCDIKSVYNHFFEEQMISYPLHSRIVYDPSPIGAQGNVWDELLNELAKQPAAHVLNVFIKVLSNNKFHSNLIAMLKRLLRKKRSLKCRCPNQNLVDNSQNIAVDYGHTDKANDNYSYTRHMVTRQEVETKGEHLVITQNNGSYKSNATGHNTDLKEVYTNRESNDYKAIRPSTLDLPVKLKDSPEASTDEITPKTAVIMDSNITPTANSQEIKDGDETKTRQAITQEYSSDTHINNNSTGDNTDLKEVYTERESNYGTIWPLYPCFPVFPVKSHPCESSTDETKPKTAAIMDNITATVNSPENDNVDNILNRNNNRSRETNERNQRQKKFIRKPLDIKKMKQKSEELTKMETETSPNTFQSP